MNCCICNKEIKGYGNNAEPYKKGTCCDKCNNELVIPTRMLDIYLFTKEDIKTFKTLIKQTGAGSRDAKLALIYSNFDIDRATEWLRKHGLC